MIKLNGEKYKINFESYKKEDELEVKLPSYTIISTGKVFYEKKWRKCIFRIHDFPEVMKIFISPEGVFKDGMSEIGKVDSQGFSDIVEVRGIKRFFINTYHFIFIIKLQFLSLIDRAKLIKKNLIYISIALIGASIYYTINYLYDGFLQDLINESNLVQSIIVFLSLSSIINIFHPFTLHRTLKIGDIDKLITKKQERKDKNLTRRNRITNLKR